MATQVLHAGSDKQTRAAARKAARALKAGKLVGFATETVYGIAAVASLPETMERLRELKSRPSRPFSVHVASPDDVGRYVRDAPPDAEKLIRKCWPGPVTLLLPTGGKLAESALQKRGLHDVLVHDGVIGLRCPAEPAAQAMLAGVPEPVVAPSANLAGQPSPRSGQEVLAALDGKIDVLLDSGPTRYGKDSTIVLFGADGKWNVVRQGVLDERAIRRALRTTLLFVCTGNTCRSPMAAGLARKLLAERLGCTIRGLESRGVEVLSAGVVGGGHCPATPEAVAAARHFGADIRHHRSRKLTSELIHDADMIFCMTEFHAEAARELAPAAADRIVRLSAAGDIPDPIGGGGDVYRRTAENLLKAVQERLDKVSV